METISNSTTRLGACDTFIHTLILRVDTAKLYTKAHGAKVVPYPSNALFLKFGKTTNLIINLDHDEWILDDDSKTLSALGFGMCRHKSLARFSLLT